MKVTTLNVNLPEDILKLKLNGEFELMEQMIDYRLKKDLPSQLKERLELEKELITRYKEQYIYTKEEALQICLDNIQDFTKEDFDELFLDGAFDFIYDHGKLMIIDDFYANLIKTRVHLQNRAKIPFDRSNFELLDQTILKMQEKGALSYYMHIRASLKIKKEYEKVGKVVRVWLPIPIEYAQVEDFKIISTSPQATLINPPDADHRCVYFECELEENQEFVVEYSFINHSIYHQLDPNIVTDEKVDIGLEENKPHYVFSDYLVSLTNEVIGNETNPLLKARKIYDFITTHVMYSFVRPYISLPLIPDYVATSLKGDCGLQASLFITMCRIAGIPCCWQAGLYSTPLDIGNHDWARFYIAPYGWLFADCSFGGAGYRDGSKLRHDFFFGHLEPFRIPMAKEFMADLVPLNQFTRKDPYDNQNGECEYIDENIEANMFDTYAKVIEIKEL